jgi:hypothetical protein
VEIAVLISLMEGEVLITDRMIVAGETGEQTERRRGKIVPCSKASDPAVVHDDFPQTATQMIELRIHLSLSDGGYEQEGENGDHQRDCSCFHDVLMLVGITVP